MSSFLQLEMPSLTGRAETGSEFPTDGFSGMQHAMATCSAYLGQGHSLSNPQSCLLDSSRNAASVLLAKPLKRSSIRQSIVRGTRAMGNVHSDVSCLPRLRSGRRSLKKEIPLPSFEKLLTLQPNPQSIMSRVPKHPRVTFASHFSSLYLT